MTENLTALNTLIARKERAAIAKAMCGQWTDADDARLAALYAERRLIHEKGTHHA